MKAVGARLTDVGLGVGVGPAAVGAGAAVEDPVAVGACACATWVIDDSARGRTSPVVSCLARILLIIGLCFDVRVLTALCLDSQQRKEEGGGGEEEEEGQTQGQDMRGEGTCGETAQEWKKADVRNEEVAVP